MGLSRAEKYISALCLFVAITAGVALFNRLINSGNLDRSNEVQLAQVFPMGAKAKLRISKINSWTHLFSETKVYDRDRFYSGDSAARVVLQDSTELNLKPHTLISFRRGQRDEVQFEITQGSLSIRKSSGKALHRWAEGSYQEIKSEELEEGQKDENNLPILTAAAIASTPLPSSAAADEAQLPDLGSGKSPSLPNAISFADLIDSETAGQRSEEQAKAAAVVPADLPEAASDAPTPPQPQWLDTSLTHFLAEGDPPKLQWQKDESTHRFLVQIATDKDFKRVIREDYTLENSFKWHEALAGKFYARLYGLNRQFVRGPASETLPIDLSLAPPQQIRKLSSNFDARTGQGQLVLSWNSNSYANKYEIQIDDSDSFDTPNVYRTSGSALPAQLSNADPRYVKVRIIDSENSPTSEFSEVTRIDIDQVRGMASEEVETVVESDVPINSDEWRRKRPTFSIVGGVGANYFQLKQTRSDGADSEYKGMMAPTLMLEGSYFQNEKLSYSLSYHQFLGQLQARTFVGQTGAKFKWETIGAEGKYILRRKEKFDYSLITGFQMHRTPNGYLNSDNTITFEYENITNLSLGGMVEYVAAPDIILEGYMRYQHPVVASGPGGSGFKVNSKLIFDGSVGVTKYFTDEYKFGFYWFGQYHNFSHEGQSAGAEVSGSRDYLNSNLQLRFGYEH